MRTTTAKIIKKRSHNIINWGIFSNFAHTPIIATGMVYDTAERLFQSSKMNYDDTHRMVYKKRGNPKMTARHLTLEHPEWVGEDWYQTYIDVMRNCLELKYQQSEEFRKELVRSERLFIVEDQTNYTNERGRLLGHKTCGKRIYRSQPARGSY